MSYGILIWGDAADIDTIFILQKRAMRAIYIIWVHECPLGKHSYGGHPTIHLRMLGICTEKYY